MGEGRRGEREVRGTGSERVEKKRINFNNLQDISSGFL